MSDYLLNCFCKEAIILGTPNSQLYSFLNHYIDYVGCSNIHIICVTAVRGKMLGYLLRLIRRDSESNEISADPAKVQYPIDKLSNYVGQVIDVEYLNQDIPRKARAKLYCKPSPEFFYLSEHEGSCFIVHWNREDAQGKLDVVRSIKSLGGYVIFENTDIVYDVNAAIAEEQKRNTGAEEQKRNSRGNEAVHRRINLGRPDLDSLALNT